MARALENFNATKVRERFFVILQCYREELVISAIKNLHNSHARRLLSRFT